MAEKRANNVVHNSVEIPTRKKVKDAFIKNDGKTIRDYAFFDVLIPSVKRLIYDLINRVTGMALLDNKTPGSSIGSSGYASQYQQVIYRAGDVNYRPSNNTTPSRPQVSNSMFEYENWVFSDRGDIEAVLNLMTDIIENYGIVSVNDLYDAVGKAAPYTAENYGWKTMNGCDVKICSGGFRLAMTRPSLIDNYKK